MREAFLLDPDLVFLNHGSYGACPRQVFEVMQGWQREMERNPVAFLGRRSGELLRRARETLGAFLNVPTDELAFVPNATSGVNLAARALAGLLQPGDEVLAPDLEYGACDETWLRVCAARGAAYRTVPIPLPLDDGVFVETLLAAATPRTKIVFLSHVASATALRLPVETLVREARRAGIASVVDGAHAPGQIDLDLAAIGADAYTGNGHKWLCAPKGAAFLHLRPEWHAQASGLVTSWGDVAGDKPASPFDAYTGRTPLERRLQWQGTRDLAAFLTLPAAIDFHRRHLAPRSARCHAEAVALMHRVAARQGLRPIGHDHHFLQMAPLPVRCADPAGLCERLAGRWNIEVPVTVHGPRSFVRVSVAAYTTAAELQRLEDALAVECPAP
jgi:isopenicillin-N epimerase